MADSIRVPTATESPIVLNVTFQAVSNGEGTPINTKVINGIYKTTASNDPEHLLIYSEEDAASDPSSRAYFTLILLTFMACRQLLT